MQNIFMGVYLIVGCLGLTCISIGKQYAKRSIENACEIWLVIITNWNNAIKEVWSRYLFVWGFSEVLFIKYFYVGLSYWATKTWMSVASSQRDKSSTFFFVYVKVAR